MTELNNMIPWEREVYLGLLVKQIEEENKKRKQAKMR
tara:strand:+ start:264 stop:374 length:111 start_codon:yes stop_codon:yes gene_type:complete